MTEEEFARGLVEHVVDQNARLYAEVFGIASPAEATDSFWRAAAGLYSTLRPEQQRTLLAFFRQVTIDAVSSTLAVLDGVASLPDQEVRFELRHGGDVLSNALQDYFLAQVDASGGAF